MRNVLILFLGFSLHATTTTVSTGPQLRTALQNAAAGDTILLNDGIYTVTPDPTNLAFDIPQSVTLRSINGASHVTLNGAGWYITVQIDANNVTMDGITISGSRGFGVYVTNRSNVVLRNLAISTAAPPVGASGQGIAFSATNSVIELCTVSNTDGHAISMNGGNWNLIINNIISNTGGNGIGMPLLLSDHNVIVGNTLTNIGADGILLDSSQYNYVAFNNIIGPHNGVTLSDEQNPARHSIRNYVGNNMLTLSGKSGSDGVWINNDSNWNMVAVNDTSGSGENGLALYSSIGNYLRGNSFHQNPTGGVYLFNSSGTMPVNNSIQRNYMGYHGSNGGVITNHAGATDVGFNFIAGNPLLTGTPIAGFLVEGTSNSRFYSNVIENLSQGENIDSATTNSSLYLNRYFNVLYHYTFRGAGVQWDSGSTVLGGNFFSDFVSANGNPSNGGSPYTNIIDNSVMGKTGAYEDRYPYQSESMGREYRVVVQTPPAGVSLAAGSQKTISWNSQGCVFVDINLLNSSNSSTPIASNYQDFGYLRWTVPAVTPGAYSLQVNCKNSAGAAVGASATGPAFHITSSDLVLLSPETDLLVDPGQSTLISWKKSANVTQPVSVYIRYSDSGTYTLLQTVTSGDFVAVPITGAASNRVSVQVVSGTFADSTDGWLTTRNGNGQFTSPAAPTPMYVGTPYPLEWVSPPATDYVNIDLLVGSNTKNVVTGLADFGKYVMLVPDFEGTNASLRLTFYNAAGNSTGTATATGLAVQSSPCDINGDGVANVADVQEIINEALGVAPVLNDLNGDGVVTVADVQVVIVAAHGMGCPARY